ncbi:TetR/AcrR family transcriptional regulator [Ancylobacter sp. 6x-1]|uniref:TetR/AcrR family transcriptional regulator n=1 Tax=Ancylobacter crimeensis TaxID=2579147 RepID=A0ABT0D9U4_9HYPH|nr:TetR/AcrR family transcriptional regulator [Ancylobacter crimeensis]MCK0196726.1 TetR/AcrR family transcriptional regulator [Ancylobacter crimeensis]
MDKHAQIEDTPRGRGRPKTVSDEAQRKRIIEAAFALLCEEGYGRMTMDDVAAHCRMSKKTLYRLFPGKLALFSAVTDSHRETMIDLRRGRDDLPLVESLTRIFLCDTSVADDRARAAFIRVVMVECERYPELKAVVEERGRDMTHAELTAWIERQNALGRMAVEDSRIAARMLMDIVFNPLVRSSEGHHWPGFGEPRAYVRRCLELFIEGARPRA